MLEYEPITSNHADFVSPGPWSAGIAGLRLRDQVGSLTFCIRALTPAPAVGSCGHREECGGFLGREFTEVGGSMSRVVFAVFAFLA